MNEVIILAKDFVRGNFNRSDHPFGEGIIIDGGNSSGFAEYEIYFPSVGVYELWTRYASGEVRPVDIYFDNLLIRRGAMNNVTGGATLNELKWFKEATHQISIGYHNLRISCDGVIPHIERLKFKRVGPTLVKGHRYKKIFDEIYEQRFLLGYFLRSINEHGLNYTFKKSVSYLTRGLINNHLDILGVFDGSYAYTGPNFVQIDLTNNCNNNCIGCWCNSPLLGDRRMDPITKQKSLPYGLVEELIDELAKMGTKEIYYSGGGEPFMHPDVMKIIEYTKQKGMVCYINTNFTLIDEDIIRKLIDLKVDHMTISLWAGDAKIYDDTHPNKTKETFYQIRERLKLLNSSKNKKPYVKLYNVISNMNYHNIDRMIDFALETKSESVEFTMIDTIPDATDKLLLNHLQTKELIERCNQIKRRLETGDLAEKLILFRFDQFLRRISNVRDTTKGEYDKGIIDRIPCYIGWTFSRILPDGDVNACLKAHRIPVGNIYKQRFSQIWSGKLQRWFREKALKSKKDDPFFALIGNDPNSKVGCYKSCDDIGRNVHMYKKIKSLTTMEMVALRLIAKFKRYGRRVSPFYERVLSRIRVRSTAHPLFLEKSLQDNLDIAGILDGRRAFIGPEHVVIDLTNRCNERCIGCWIYSPLLGMKRPSKDWLGYELSFETVKNLVDELSELGTKRIRFTGGGEPFLHPKIMELTEYVKKKDMICAVTTNFSLVNEGMIKGLIELGLDDLAVSLWAGDATTYRTTHPGRKEDDFYRIEKALKLLFSLKNNKPYLTLCNVILNLNYQNVDEMLNFAIDVGADAIYFTAVDTIPGAIDSLMLSKEENELLLAKIAHIKDRVNNLTGNRKLMLDNLDAFIRRVSSKGAPYGEYDRDIVDTIPCYVGWIFSRILANGDVSPCCRGVKKVMGNINKRSFRDIWNSGQYSEFRAKAKYLSKNDAYFKDVGCIKECDNLMHNEEMHKRINAK